MKVQNLVARIAQTLAAMARLQTIWRDRNIKLRFKIQLMRSLALSAFLYAWETWTLTADLQRRIQATEMRCYRKILGINYTDRITNDEVRCRTRRWRWEDNIKEWTGLSFAESQRAVEDREGWRRVAATAPVVPQRHQQEVTG